MIIVGSDEESSRTVSARRHKQGDIGTFSLKDFIYKLKTEVADKSLPPTHNS